MDFEQQKNNFYESIDTFLTEFDLTREETNIWEQQQLAPNAHLAAHHGFTLLIPDGETIPVVVPLTGKTITNIDAQNFVENFFTQYINALNHQC